MAERTYKMTHKDDIAQWLNDMDIKHYIIHNNLKVDVEHNVNLSRKNLNFIPVQFGQVKGFFDCSFNQLRSLDGAPLLVGSHYSCHTNKLLDLEGVPEVIHGNFYCLDNLIRSLSPLKEIKGNLSCTDNLLHYFEFDTFKDVKIGNDLMGNFINVSLNKKQIAEIIHLNPAINEDSVKIRFNLFKTFLEQKKFNSVLANNSKQNKIKI